MFRGAACLVLGLIVAVLVLAGCAVRTPADPMRLAGAAEPAPAIAWPARRPGWSHESVAVREEPRDVWYAAGSGAGRRWEFYFSTVTFRFTEVVQRGQGVLVRVTHERPVDSDSALGSYPASGYLFYSSATPMFPVGIYDPARDPAAMVPAEPISPATLWLYEPREGPPRGLVVFLPSIGDWTYERRVIRALLARGWAVLGSAMPMGTLLMFGEPRPPGDTPEAFGARLARRMDDRLAEWAYGVEAVLEDLAERRPDIPQDRVVVMGCSAGAIGAPAVAARLGGRVRAAVLVGGGADLGRIVHTSTLFSGFHYLLWARLPLKADELERLSRGYLEASALDPYHTAAALRGVPVLQLHATGDTIVPAATGDLLYERLARPERWTFNIGHELLIWRLPAYADQIADWVERATASIPASQHGD